MAILRRIVSRCRNPHTGVFNEAWYDYDDVELYILRIGCDSFKSNHPKGLTGKRDITKFVSNKFAMIFYDTSGNIIKRFDFEKDQEVDNDIDDIVKRKADPDTSDTPMFPMSTRMDGAVEKFIFDGYVQCKWDWRTDDPVLNAIRDQQEKDRLGGGPPKGGGNK